MYADRGEFEKAIDVLFRVSADGYADSGLSRVIEVLAASAIPSLDKLSWFQNLISRIPLIPSTGYRDRAYVAVAAGISMSGFFEPALDYLDFVIDEEVKAIGLMRLAVDADTESRIELLSGHIERLSSFRLQAVCFEHIGWVSQHEPSLNRASMVVESILLETELEQTRAAIAREDLQHGQFGTAFFQIDSIEDPAVRANVLRALVETLASRGVWDYESSEWLLRALDYAEELPEDHQLFSIVEIAAVSAADSGLPLAAKKKILDRCAATVVTPETSRSQAIVLGEIASSLARAAIR
jgi:hypothetical protein